MTEISLDEGRIKELMKQAMLELLKERRDLIYDVFAEVIEDLAFANAIKEGEIYHRNPTRENKQRI